MAAKETKVFTRDGVDYTFEYFDRIAVENVLDHMVRVQLFHVRAGTKNDTPPVPKNIRDSLLRKVS